MSQGILIPPACGYPAHRPFDWLGLDVGMPVCGKCHPPARPLVERQRIVRRGEPDYDVLREEWEAKQRKVIVADRARKDATRAAATAAAAAQEEAERRYP